mmetsp:Transcript_16344/g.32891  ORF Transcript_16344/g.32891 Transcript_16344/m.32891 type:complete len:132 (-) Transcript_16344:2153-2548(-)
MLVRLHLAELLVDEDAGEDTSYAPKESDSISPITSVGRNFDLRDSSALLQNTLERQFVSALLSSYHMTFRPVPSLFQCSRYLDRVCFHLESTSCAAVPRYFKIHDMYRYLYETRLNSSFIHAPFAVRRHPL